jgi:hypothetical protein
MTLQPGIAPLTPYDEIPYSSHPYQHSHPARLAATTEATWRPVIKYLGSKRRVIPALTEIFASCRPRTALDLFTGTTRVAQALKRIGANVTAVDSARYAHVLAQCFVATDSMVVDHVALADEIDRLNALAPEPGYVTDLFCVQARYFQPRNGARIDAIRAAIARDHAGTWMEPVLLTALMLAADRVDSTTGVQMAYLKGWSARSRQPLRLRSAHISVADRVGDVDQEHRCDARCVVGHFHFSNNAFERYRDSWQFVTVLRNPIERWLSHYSYNLNSSSKYSIEMPLAEVVETNRARNFGRAYVDEVTDDIDKEQLGLDALIDTAIARFKSFALVGAVEKTPDFAQRFDQKFGYRLDIKRLNETPASKRVAAR